MRTVTISIGKILELISCAEDWGFVHEILFSGFAEIIEKLSDEEIEQYARSIEQQDGFSHDDYIQIKSRLVNFRDRYLRLEPIS